MNCPLCGRQFLIGEEILYKVDNIYYCTHCWRPISNYTEQLSHNGFQKKVTLTTDETRLKEVIKNELKEELTNYVLNILKEHQVV